MTKLNFKIDIEKDLWNWCKSYDNKVSKFDGSNINWQDKFPQNLLKIIEQEKLEKRTIIREYIQDKYYSTNWVNNFIKKLSQSWGEIENEYLLALSSLFGSKKIIDLGKITFYPTTFPRMPYNIKERWIMLCLSPNINSRLTGIAHELLHFQFLSLYENKLKKQGLNKKQIETLKEAITVLLNAKILKAYYLFQIRGMSSIKNYDN